MALVANALILAPLALAAWLHGGDSQRYYLTTQEDGWVEWATAWSFLLAVPIMLWIARRLRLEGIRFPWFPLGVAAFCLFVALEEISWGQRLLGYRPPDYFLAENFQQELNFHNVVATSYRKLALSGVILGYGVILPLLSRPRPIAALCSRLGIVVPAAALAPAFFVNFLVYDVYPWKHTGEWVELALGLGFLCASLLHFANQATMPRWGEQQPWLVPVGGAALAVALGAGTAWVSAALAKPDPVRVQEAERELAALSNDFASDLVETDCNLHKRLYTFVVERDQPGLWEGEFAALADLGMPEERAEFLLDPWNSPYWLRDRCENGRRIAFVYSFGPNRRRDSTRTELLGDDLGAIFVNEPF